MKVILLTTALTLIASSTALAQPDGMKGMTMKNGDMKNMPMQVSQNQKTHKTTGIVKKASPAAGTVTIDHDPVKTLNWPAMTMTFTVKDKALFDKLRTGGKAGFEFVQEGKNYVITAVTH